MLKKLLILFVAVNFYFVSSSQNNYWRQQVNYTIDVSLNDADKSLQAFEKIEYINNSPDTLHFIWFHLWPNAYKNDRTAFSKQLLKNDETDFYFSGEDKRGYINQLDFKVNDEVAELQTDSLNIDIAKLILPKALPPHQSIIITTPFYEKLPYNISRGGYVGQTYQVTQWFPKPAVYDSKDWHQMPYLDQGEFYSEFGNWKVSITLPENYIVAASGDLQSEDELQHLIDLTKQKPNAQKNYKLFQQLLADAKKDELLQQETIAPPSSKKTKTLIYTLNNAHDFAWFASKVFLVQHDTVQLQTHTVDVFSYYNPWQADEWKNSIHYMKDAVRFYSNNVGEYPYNIVSAVAGNEELNSGGMEYPTITLITLNASQQKLDATLAHEIGHNWFYGILATNERDHAWMDEGINTYYQQRYETEKYGNTSDEPEFKSGFMKARMPSTFNETEIAALEKFKKDQPIDTTAAAYTQTNYSLMVYQKTPLWMRNLQQKLGTEKFDSSMKFYFQQWQFKHPYPQDFKNAIEQSSNTNIDSLYSKIFETGPIVNKAQSKQIRFATFFNLKQTDTYNYISALPVIGYNNFDKLMIGVAFHNYQLPLNKFTFIMAPLYAINAKQLNGAARFSYNVFQKRYWLETSLSGITYSFNSYDNGVNKPLYLRVERIVPSVKLVLYDKDLVSTQRMILQARSFLLREDALNFKTVINSTDTFDIITKQPVNSYINQLKFTFLDNRILFPYSGELTIDQGKQFIRAGFTGKYFFNYSNNTGVNARLFAGKFFYLSSSPDVLKLQRYNFTLKGPDGYQDYTYSDYFIGRSEFDGGMSQQIMERDGFFKVETDLQQSNSGITDNWLIAANLNADFPDFFNPFKILPFELPVKVFFDIGTFGSAKKYQNSDVQLRYDAGLQLSALHSALNIYFPLLYSKIYSDYYKSVLGKKHFWKTVSFSIDLSAFKLNNISNKIPL